jgi:hypothetical protein
VSEAVEVILAAGPSVVALAALGLVVWQQRRGVDQARELADLADARALLDDAARALRDADYARHGMLMAGPAGVTGVLLERLDKAGAAMDAIGIRLAIRLGDEDVVRQFRTAGEALLAISREVHAPADATDPDEQWQEVQAASARFQDAGRRFIAAAGRIVGARL